MMATLQQLTSLLTNKQLTIAVAESCTGGALSAQLTKQSGSSEYFDRGFITYSNQAKIDMLGVSSHTLEEFGAVSEQVAGQMANGVIDRAKVDISVAVTGIAGPSGGSAKKPVGTVCFGFCISEKCFTNTQVFSGDRMQVVNSSIEFVLTTLINELNS